MQKHVNTLDIEKNEESQRHELFLEHDMEIVKKMLSIVKSLTNETVPKNSYQLLIKLGQIAFEIKHDEDDKDCIRNKFGDYSDEKGKPREDRFCESGIPFQGLFYIGKWCEKKPDYLNEISLQTWLNLNQAEFHDLYTKLKNISTKVPSTTTSVLGNINQLGECANDILHLQMVIEVLEVSDVFINFELNDSKSRYALARAYSILGETVKQLSRTFSNHLTLKSTFHKLGQCRDLVKLPFLMPKTSRRMLKAQKFLESHGSNLCKFFKNIKDEIENKLKKGELQCISTYRNWVDDEIKRYIQILNIDILEEDIKSIMEAYRLAKRDEKSVDKEKSKLEKRDEAVCLIKSYQKINKSLEELDALIARKPKNIEAIKKKIRKKKRFSDKVFKKYNGIYEILVDYQNMPTKNHDSIMACDVSIFEVVPKTNVKKPKDKLLLFYVTSVEEIYEQLNSIYELNSIYGSSSNIMGFAYDQCVAFLGQLFKEIRALFQIIFSEPISTVWNEDFVQTIQLRNSRLMHNVVNYDPTLIRKFVHESILPWEKNFHEFSVVANFNYISSVPDNQSILDFNPPIYNQLGIAYTNLEQWKKAKKKFKDAIKYFKDNNDDDGMACIMHNLADVYRSEGNWKKATKWMKSTWDYRKKNLPKKHPYYVSTILNLGMCYDNLKQTQNTLNCFLTSLDVCKENNLDQKQSLYNLANFYADQMNYIEALKYYEQLLKIPNLEKEKKLYLFCSLEPTAIECGEYMKANVYYEKMKKLFLQNRSYFKQQLSCSEYLKFQEKMIGPIYILILTGHFQEALDLLNKNSNLSFIYQVLKFRILRDLQQNVEAEKLGKHLLSQIENNTDYAITIEVIYADVLIKLNRDEEEPGVPRLIQMCEEIEQIHQHGNIKSQHLLSPYNSLCRYYLRKKQYTEAKSCILSALKLLEKANLSSLSDEILVVLHLFYIAHLLGNETETINKHVERYEHLIIERIKQRSDERVMEMFSELIELMTTHNYLDTAKIFLTAYASSPNFGRNFELSLAKHYVSLADALIQVGQVDKAIDILYVYLDKNHTEECISISSFYLAKYLYDNTKLDLLCQIVSDFQSYWDEKLSFSVPLSMIFIEITRFSFICFVLKIISKHFDESIAYAKIFIRLIPKIYSLLNKEKDVSNEQLHALEYILYCQFWYTLVSIREFSHPEQTSKVKTYNDIFINLIKDKKPQVVSMTDDLQKCEVDKTIPTYWHHFLSACKSNLSCKKMRNLIKDGNTTKILKACMSSLNLAKNIKFYLEEILVT